MRTTTISTFGFALSILAACSAPAECPEPAAPKPTAICADGSTSYSQHASGTCSNHGGVREWVNRPAR